MRLIANKSDILELAHVYVTTDCTTRSLAAQYGCSKTTIHKRLHDCCFYDQDLYSKVQEQIQANIDGGRKLGGKKAFGSYWQRKKSAL